MRPRRLQLEGFTAYREFTVLDLEGAELFVLTGPTGSGKSSLIDAITFALYGSVARYANPNIVYPVISQGKLEAKVRFDFTVGDEPYTAVRVVRKTPKGATTREARLESRQGVLAGNADEVSSKVREILGLDFEQFNTCVVLPQGEFARFLHEKPGERQNLLTKLLGLGIYDEMRGLAHGREGVARQLQAVRENELAAIAGATKKAQREAVRRVEALAELEKDIESRQPNLDAWRSEIEKKTQEAVTLEREADGLEAVRVPDGVGGLAKKLTAANRSLESAAKERAEAESLVEKTEAERAGLGGLTELRELSRAHEDHTAKRQRHVELERCAKEAARTRSETEKRHQAARAGVEQARSEAEDARAHHAAHTLAARLEKGKPCPVCGRGVTKLPERALPFALEDAESRVQGAEERLGKQESALRGAERTASVADERLSSSRKELAALEKALAGAPGPAATASTIAQVEKSERRLDEARRDLKKARADEARAQSALDALREEEGRAWRAFDDARDALATLAPPRADRESLGDAWAKLLSWVAETLPRRRKLAASARGAAAKAKESRRKALAAIGDAASKLGIDVDEERPRDAVVSALAAAEHERKRIDEARTRAEELEVDVERQREAARVAGALARHLRADGFERWLLDEAFRRLVSGATSILRELSSGQYSFECDDRLNFEVVDHRNADERRSARTLSGGETFLASLALALTLAEQTAELATRGSARLESLFLDEGFGTLDADTLDVVAAAIEELGARGRIVGLVTHQQSLADKISVQYRVSKGPATSTVEKVVA